MGPFHYEGSVNDGDFELKNSPELIRNGARRIAVIEIWDDPRGNKSPRTDVANVEGYFRIVLSNGDLGIDKPTVLAHELGHVVAKALHMPGAANDPNLEIPNLMQTVHLAGFMPKSVHERMVNAEKEAWDVAEKIVPVKATDKDRALLTYIRPEGITIR